MSDAVETERQIEKHAVHLTKHGSGKAEKGNTKGLKRQSPAKSFSCCLTASPVPCCQSADHVDKNAQRIVIEIELETPEN